MNRSHNKQIGYQSEELAGAYYKDRGYRILIQNYTIRGGEVDLFVENYNTLVLVEVKTVNFLHDYCNYITPKKLFHLQKTFDFFLAKHPGKRIESKSLRIDVVFVKDKHIFQVYENITNT